MARNRKRPATATKPRKRDTDKVRVMLTLDAAYRKRAEKLASVLGLNHVSDAIRQSVRQQMDCEGKEKRTEPPPLGKDRENLMVWLSPDALKMFAEAQQKCACAGASELVRYCIVQCLKRVS